MGDIVAELAAAAQANLGQRACQVCQALDSLSDEGREDVREAIISALKPSGHGSIGGKTLAKILTSNGYPTGERAIIRHRREDHTP